MEVEIWLDICRVEERHHNWGHSHSIAAPVDTYNRDMGAGSLAEVLGR